MTSLSDKIETAKQDDQDESSIASNGEVPNPGLAKKQENDDSEE